MPCSLYILLLLLLYDSTNRSTILLTVLIVRMYRMNNSSFLLASSSKIGQSKKSIVRDDNLWTAIVHCFCHPKTSITTSNNAADRFMMNPSSLPPFHVKKKYISLYHTCSCLTYHEECCVWLCCYISYLSVSCYLFLLPSAYAHQIARNNRKSQTRFTLPRLRQAIELNWFVLHWLVLHYIALLNWNTLKWNE